MPGFTHHTLSNGLQVYLKEIHTAPIISHWLWYRVGSRDEPTGKTGISHWVEHMQFKGTPNFPVSDLDRIIAREGGVWNAFTFQDWTTYFESLPADKIDIALRLEADRMSNSLFAAEEVASERTVVISERQGDENEPLFRLGEEIAAASFRVHPYHHEIIGDMADLQSMQREDLLQHYHTYYVPNNAVLTIAGDFETQAMLARVRELYEPIPSGGQPPRLARPEPPQRGERRVEVLGEGETTYVQIAYHAPQAAHPDFFPLMVLDSLLSGPSGLNMFGGGGISNKTSRLYRCLVESEKAVTVHGTLQATLDPYLYVTSITVHPQSSVEQVLSVFDDEIKRIQDAPPSQDELLRAVKQAKALFAYSSESITNQAFWMGYAEMFDSYDWFERYVEKISAVTLDDVQRVLRTYMTPSNRTVGIYVPQGNGAAPENFVE